jgi:Fe-S-cluster-containing hydrogenase component 2
MNTCPAEAIFLEESTGAKILNEEKCIGCRMCMIAYPFGAISIDPLTKKVVKCDLCSGEPACAQWCPTGAIEYGTPRSYDLVRQRGRLEAMGKKGLLGGR